MIGLGVKFHINSYSDQTTVIFPWRGFLYEIFKGYLLFSRDFLLLFHHFSSVLTSMYGPGDLGEMVNARDSFEKTVLPPLFGPTLAFRRNGWHGVVLGNLPLSTYTAQMLTSRQTQVVYTA